MKTPGLLALLLITSTGLFAQVRGGGASPGVAARAMPAPAAQTQRGVVGPIPFPTGTFQPITPGSPILTPGRTGVNRFRKSSGTFLYGYPVYVGGYGYGGYGYGGYYDSPYAGQPAPVTGQEQPNVIVVYPQQTPTIVSQFGPGDAQGAPRVQPQTLVYPPAPGQAEEPGAEPVHYLIAFKDHSIYSAVAYWVDGDTLHYFTTPTTHNQASVSLVDRELTDRLNKESGAEVKLPPSK